MYVILLLIVIKYNNEISQAKINRHLFIIYQLFTTVNFQRLKCIKSGKKFLYNGSILI
jgi:hypothetical protein